MAQIFDLLVVGGGVNGAGIARDAAGRGLTVRLVEQDDLARYTSSSSTKLIHGGLRYLEYYEFRLVREALIEREILLGIAPHLIRPLQFVLPHDSHLRPAWEIRMGLFLYDYLGGRHRLPGSTGLRFAGNPLGAGLKPEITRGFSYYDCAVDDSRLVTLNAVDAASLGAEIRTRTRLGSARQDNGIWRAELSDLRTGAAETVEARVLVNAAGPWVSHLLSQELGIDSTNHVRLIKGSHIVVPRLYPGDHAYIVQNPDRRIVFAIPYRDRFTLIGTTDVPYTGAPGPVTIDPAETRYLCDSINHWFGHQIAPADVVWSYSGVRPLFDDAAASASAVTRDYVLELDAPAGAAPLLSVFGGKITTYRRLAEHALEKLKSHLPAHDGAWTARGALPGGDIAGGDMARFIAGLCAARPFLPPGLAARLAHAYGTRVEQVLGSAASMADLGEDFGGGLTRAEVDYLVAHEFAVTADDILWRRSKLGLQVPAASARLAEYLA